MNQSNFIFDATEENFQQGVIENAYKAPVLVAFWAQRCEPCKLLTPILEKLANELNGQFVLAKVNSETQPSLSQQFNIRSIPSVLIFKDGDVVEQFEGMQSEEFIKQLIENHSTSEADILRNAAFEIIQSVDLAHIEAREKKYAAAKSRLNNLKMADRENAQVISLLNKIDLSLATENAPSMTELEKTLADTPDASLPRYQLAIQLINNDDYEKGLDHLLYILLRDSEFQDGAVKKSLLTTFDLLGSENPLVGQYRRKMFNAMH